MSTVLGQFVIVALVWSHALLQKMTAIKMAEGLGVGGVGGVVRPQLHAGRIHWLRTTGAAWGKDLLPIAASVLVQR